jgi:DnaJ-class molecular chaperone
MMTGISSRLDLHKFVTVKMEQDDKSTSKTQANKDYYYILGVRPDATSEEISEAYHDLYEKFGPHVSVQGMDTDILIKTYKDISDAYEVLMDPKQRRDYDKSSSNSRNSSSDLRALWTKHSTQSDPDRQPKMQAMAIEMEVEVNLKEAIKGTHRQVKISDPKPCPECSGQKPVNKMQCQNCRGLGYFNAERTEEIDLPAGLYDNMDVRIAERGRFDLRAGRNGDLIVKIRLKQHPFLSVLGRDVTCTVPVTIYEAMLGSEIDVPSATGRVVMKIQPLTQSGRVYRLKGLGLAGADQLVTTEVVIPQQLSGEEVALYRRLKELSKEPNPRDAIFSKL